MTFKFKNVMTFFLIKTDRRNPTVRTNWFLFPDFVTLMHVCVHDGRFGKAFLGALQWNAHLVRCPRERWCAKRQAVPHNTHAFTIPLAHLLMGSAALTMLLIICGNGK